MKRHKILIDLKKSPHDDGGSTTIYPVGVFVNIWQIYLLTVIGSYSSAPQVEKQVSDGGNYEGPYQDQIL